MINLKDLNERAGILNVLSAYGIYPNEHGFIYCLAHEDNHPSMKVFERDNKVYCFTCHASMDCIDVVQKLENCDRSTAVKRIEAICGIRADKQTRQELNRIKLQRARKKAQQNHWRRLFIQNCELLHIFEEAYKEIVPDEITDEFRNDNERVDTAMMYSQCIDFYNKEIDKLEILLNGGAV